MKLISFTQAEHQHNQKAIRRERLLARMGNWCHDKG